MKMIIEELMCHFHRVTYLNFKRDFMEIMPQLPPLKFQKMPLFHLFVCFCPSKCTKDTMFYMQSVP